MTFFSPHVKDPNWLGLLTNMFSIGSILSFFITLVALLSRRAASPHAGHIIPGIAC